MRDWIKITLSSAGVLLIVVATVAGVAANGATAHPTTAHPTTALLASGVSKQPANAHPLLKPAAAPADSAIGSTYTPVAPCRIVDTRVHGGAIRANHSRSFHALGTSEFKDQGGQACNIPHSATAVTGSVIAVSATGTGYLKVYAYQSAEPDASFLNFAKSTTLSAAGTIPVSARSKDFTVAVASHATQVVIQLTGYYIAPMWARINPDGSKNKGSRVVSTSHVGTGEYQVDFDRNVSGCAYSATAYYAGNTMEVQPRTGDVKAVFVESTVAASSAPADTAFYLTVTC